jgi:SPP1 gp7 family putative phage head morphogenesis protein
MAGQPILPRSITNPVGQSSRVNRVTGAIDDALATVEDWLIQRFEQIPTESIVVSRFFINRSRYEYQISIPDLELLVEELAVQLGIVPDQYVVDQVIGAYEVGTNLAVTNLANISDDYTRNITQVLMSEPYQRRVALIGARVFEEMQGFEGDTGRDLARVLREAVQDGLNPRDVVETIRNRFGVARSRAARIAQTEITGALRRGRWDEAQDAETRLGLRVRLLWVSALKPTTRLWHASRHGGIYTVQEVREFYATGANAIFCYCGQVEILVNSDGTPVTGRPVLKLKKQKEAYFGE